MSENGRGVLPQELGLLAGLKDDFSLATEAMITDNAQRNTVVNMMRMVGQLVSSYPEVVPYAEMTYIVKPVVVFRKRVNAFPTEREIDKILDLACQANDVIAGMEEVDFRILCDLEQGGLVLGRNGA